MAATDPRPANKTYFGVQALRAVAALSVVVHHACGGWNERLLTDPRKAILWLNAQVGVDIFFVISGFVMAVTAPGLAGKKHKPWVFLWRRLVRIVPLYWIFTTVKILRLQVGPASQAQETIGGWPRVVLSYLFVPTADHSGLPIPIHGVG